MCPGRFIGISPYCVDKTSFFYHVISIGISASCQVNYILRRKKRMIEGKEDLLKGGNSSRKKALLYIL